MTIDPSQIGQHLYGLVHILRLLVKFSEFVYTLPREANLDDGVFGGGPVRKKLEVSAFNEDPLGIPSFITR